MVSHGQSCIWGYTGDQSLPKPLRHFKAYSSKSLGLFASLVAVSCFILNHMPRLTQQLTPNDEEGPCFRGAVGLSSLFDNFLKSFQANCRPEIGSNTLRLDVFVPGLNDSSLGGELPLDPFFFFGFLELWKRENCWRMSGRGSQPVAVSCLGLFSFSLEFFLGSLYVFCCFLFG